MDEPLKIFGGETPGTVYHDIRIMQIRDGKPVWWTIESDHELTQAEIDQVLTEKSNAPSPD